jgi:hypothetical protein
MFRNSDTAIMLQDSAVVVVNHMTVNFQSVDYRSGDYTRQQDRQHAHKRNTETRYRNNFCCGKAVSQVLNIPSLCL